MNIDHRDRVDNRGVVGFLLEGEPAFPVSPSNSPSFLLSPPDGRDQQ